FGSGTRLEHRPISLALPGGTSRLVGLRWTAADPPVHPGKRWAANPRHRPRQQERLLLHPRPAHRQAPLRRERGARVNGPVVAKTLPHAAATGHRPVDPTGGFVGNTRLADRALLHSAPGEA